MITNKIDRSASRPTKGVAPAMRRKANVPHLIPRLKPDRLNKPKPELFRPTTPASELKVRKPHNCLPPPETPRSSRKTPSTLKRKSISLIHLPSEDKNKLKIWTQKRIVSKEQGDEPKVTKKIKEKCDLFCFASARERELAKSVCRKFLLHAWRKGKTEIHKLQIGNNALEKEVANLNVQKCVLKDLLESENARIKHSAIELNYLKTLLVDESKSNKRLREDITKCESEKALWFSTQVNLEENLKSLQNELKIAKEHSLALNEKLFSHEKSLADCKAKETSLKDKLEISEASLKAKIIEMNNVKNKCLELQMKVEGLVLRNQELAREKESKDKQISEYKCNVKNFEVELNNLQNVQKVQSLDIVKLRNECEEAKALINIKEKEIGCLTETIKCYEAEEKEFQKKLKSTALRAFQVSLNLIPLPSYIPL